MRRIIPLLLLSVIAFGAVPSPVSTNGEMVADENGVAKYDYKGSIGLVYNPKVVAAHGIQYHRAYTETGDSLARQHLVNTADWLVKNASDKGSYSVWEYNFKWQSYGGIAPPYTSALAQAEGIYALILAHNATGNAQYLEAAKKAFGAFMVDYELGGVASQEGPDASFLQLLAKPGLEKTYVLNGHTNALLFIWKYYEYTHDYRALIVFGKGINWLVTGNLEKYDSGDWSYYDQMGTRARASYHDSHSIQLESLYGITGEPVLREYAEKFAAYARVTNSPA
jgi:hypothetical protein